MADQVARPTLRVISGDATPEEIAAILAVVSARRRGHQAGPRAATSLWSAPARGHRERQPLPEEREHGWRTSYWPR
jgi:Acyl-CoA carboxylase epsilon subunit